MRHGDQVCLLAMPKSRGKALNVPNRWWAAQPFEPAAPPTGGGQCRVHDLSPVGTNRLSKYRQGQQVRLAANSATFCSDTKAPHLGNRRATPLDDSEHIVPTSNHPRRHADQLHLGARHPRRRDHLQHASRTSALRIRGQHKHSCASSDGLAGKAMRTVQVRIQRWVVVHFHLPIDFELLAAGPNIVEQFG